MEGEEAERVLAVLMEAGRPMGAEELRVKGIVRDVDHLRSLLQRHPLVLEGDDFETDDGSATILTVWPATRGEDGGKEDGGVEGKRKRKVEAPAATGTASSSSGTEGDSSDETESLRKQIAALDAEIAEKEKHESEWDKAVVGHMNRLHEYNDIKDAAQLIMGRLATLEGVITRDMYKKYGLELDD